MNARSSSTEAARHAVRRPIDLPRPQRAGGKSVLAALWERRTNRTIGPRSRCESMRPRSPPPAATLRGHDSRLLHT
jgi:hypothetical protein